MNVSLPHPVQPTLTAEQAADQDWQALIVGAGPAGAWAARELALRSFRVLLVDKAHFPRPKICGGCLGAAALTLLAEGGLADMVERLGAPRIDALRLMTRDAQATLRLTPGVSVSRAAFDAALLREAIASGVEFLDGMTAKLEGLTTTGRQVRLRRDGVSTCVSARLVLAADGLAGGLLVGQEDVASRVATSSRIGLGAILDDGCSNYESGVVYMAHAPGGYLGVVRIEGGRLNLAAAMDADYVRSAGGPAEAAARHLRRVGLDEPTNLASAPWLGAPALTRWRRRVWSDRVLVIGDAASYIEPFTGEGMTWAMMSAQAAIQPSLEGIDAWTSRTGRGWDLRYRRLMGRRKWVCQAVAALLRRPRASSAAVRLLSMFPWLARPAMHQINRRLSCG